MSGEYSSDYMSYTVHIPPMLDNQPMDTSVAAKSEEQYVSNFLFTGGFNSVTRAHLMDNMIESKVSHPQMAGSKGSYCAMQTCDGKVMKRIVMHNFRYYLRKSILLDTAHHFFQAVQENVGGWVEEMAT
ncbi:Cellulose synthase-like protein D4 [Abeliophyllum distichum]|uniref:Cellulose synthase-like protein D4 n=1 Tax=Abeliophyllum distichum TaxID=126358 RepID=A0ABD1RAB5_9LAMI